jgi:chemotaxis protein CheC
MDLTHLQQDALVELINIGFGRAASALSKLTGHRVQLEVPEITLCPIEQMGSHLRPLVQNEVASVHQIF